VSSSSQRNKPAAVGSLLASSREAAARYAGTAIDREQWRRIVGERIALRTEPGAKRGRELTVYAATASWAQELSLLVNEIVARLKAAGVAVDTVRFRVKAIAAQPRDPGARKPVYRKAALPSALCSQLDGIDDPELREAIAEAAALWLALGETASTQALTSTAKPRATRASAAPPTSEPPDVRSPRDAELRSARSDRTTSLGRARPKRKL
jgi:hypothetical protein